MLLVARAMAVTTEVCHVEQAVSAIGLPGEGGWRGGVAAEGGVLLVARAMAVTTEVCHVEQAVTAMGMVVSQITPLKYYNTVGSY